MKELLIATTNPGKFSQLSDALSSLNLVLKSLADFQGSDDIVIKEDGQWEYAICIAVPIGQVFETSIISPRSFIGKPSKQRSLGYPMESLQIDPKTGKYIAEMADDEKSQFWQQLIGEQLCSFVQKTLNRLPGE